MVKGQKVLVSAVAPLKPDLIIDKQTGEILTPTDLNLDLTNLIETVHSLSETFYREHTQEVNEALLQYNSRMQAELFARKQSWNFPTLLLPREVKAKSRIERLIRHHLVSTVSSYVLNPNPLKKEPGFSKQINLGAIDSQMATLHRKGNQLILTFKCWLREYELYFTLPAYVLQREIKKMSLPVIRSVKGEWVFQFSTQETPVERTAGSHTAGVDLGRVAPFTLAVLNQSGSRIAHYTSSYRLNQLNSKRERIISERKHLQDKIQKYTELGVDATVVKTERDRKRAKITRLGATIANHVGAEVTQRLVKHHVSVLNMEDLRWVTGARYGSRWNHSRQQDAITHSLKRVGVKTQVVNPKNTSKHCYKCGVLLVMNTSKRTVHCVECKTVLDRDYNAAMNIAKLKKNKNVYPTDTVSSGTIVVPLSQVEQVVADTSKTVNVETSFLKQEIQHKTLR